MNSHGFPLELESDQLAKICTSQRWQQRMKAAMPYEHAPAFIQAAKQAFAFLEEADWLEAFAGHPMIGDLTSLKKNTRKENRSASRNKRRLIKRRIRY